MWKEYLSGKDRISNLWDWEVNPTQRIDIITWEIKSITEQIWLLDNKKWKHSEWEHSDILRKTQKALEELKNKIELLELLLSNKISEWTDYSNCCG